MKVLDLSVGAYGDETKLLQQQLQADYSISSSEITRAFFGPSTRAALMRWQRDHGLPPTGVLDDRTSTALSAGKQNGGSPKPTLPVTVTGPTAGGKGGAPASGLLLIQKAASPPTAAQPKPRLARAAATSTQTEAQKYTPQLTLGIGQNTQSVGPAPGIKLTVSGYAQINGLPDLKDDPTYNFHAWVTLQFSQQGTLLPSVQTVPLALAVNGDRTNWSSAMITPVGGDIDIVVTPCFTVIYGDLSCFCSPPCNNSNCSTAQPVPQTISFKAVNVDFEVNQPQDGEVLDGSAGFYALSAYGATSESGTSSSSTPLQVSSVTWQGDWTPGSPASGTAATSDGFAHWQANIQVPLGTHTLTFSVSLAGGQTARTVQRVVHVAPPAQIFDVEPVSYLQALVEFGTQQFMSDGSARVITNPGPPRQNLTPPSIDAAFYQRTLDILDTRNQEAANETVYQTRICIEVLRRYLADNPPTAALAPALQTGESAYRQAAYFSLLNQVGTSYDDIRLARTYDRNDPNDQKKLQALCDSLGIDLGIRSRLLGPPATVLKNDHLDQLFVDPGPNGSLTEGFLEQMFGLADTTRDPFSQGATIGDSQNWITRWNLAGVEWNRGTNPDGIVYLTVDKVMIPPHPPLPARTYYSVTLFSDPARTKPLASGNVSSNLALLNEVGSSGVSGQIVFASTIANIPNTIVFPYQIALSVFPRFLSWQFQRLRSGWLKDDFPSDTVLSFQLTATDSMGASASAIVNINVAHINRPTVTASPTQQQPVTPGTNVTLNVGAATASTSTGSISSYQWSQIGTTPAVTLSGAQTATPTFTVPAVTVDTVLSFQLTVTDNAGATATTSVNVTVSANNSPLLVAPGPSQCMVEGTSVTLTGTTADTNAGATITYQWNQIAGPPVDLINANTASASFTAPTNASGPIIDPDLLIKGDFKHLQDPPYSTLYVNRETQLQSWSWFPLSGFNQMLQAALGKQLSDLQALNQQSQNGTDISQALLALGLSLDAFNYILRLGALVDGGQPLLDSETKDLVSILVEVRKIKQGIPTWRTEEIAANLSLSPDFFNYPPALPSLFATGVDQYGTTLSDGSLDPHWAIISASGTVTQTFVTDSTGGSPIGVAWMRNSSASNWISPQADESHGSAGGSYTYRTNIDLSGYDPTTVQLTVNLAVDSGITSVSLNGRDLGLTAAGSSAFSTLEIIGPFQAGENTLDIVVNNTGTGNNPSGLRVELSFSSLPELMGLPAWRASLQDRQKWQETLRGRIEQNSALVEGLDSAVDTTEAQSLGPLRDALVQACTLKTFLFSIPLGTFVELPVSPDWLSQRLLMDVQADTLQKTTRIAQATEMMQSLFFSLRNSEFQQLRPVPAISSWTLNPAEDLVTFDEEWDSMGSYATWAALTLAFLYPENLLLPTLRLDPPASAGGVPQAIADQTPPFKQFAEHLSNYGGMLTPDAAVTEANTYLKTGLNAQDSSGNLIYPELPDQLNVAKTTAQFVDPRSANLSSSILSAQSALNAYALAQNWSAVAYIWEACYFVPMQIALELQQAQQFEAALAWFGILYNYDLPVDVERRIFPGLVTESTTSSYVQPPTWTITFSNPHQIAAPPDPTANNPIARACPYTRFTYLSIVQCLLDFADAQFGSETPESLSEARTLYENVLNLLTQFPDLMHADAIAASNPLLDGMRSHAENNLRKLRSGRNIAGVSTPLLVPDGPTSIQPSGYRYSALIDRAKQLVTLAQQIEGSYLASLQKGDDEAYTALRAGQDLESANASVKLEQLKVNEANDSVTLAQDQQQRAQIQVNHYNDLLSSDIVTLEYLSIGLLGGEAAAQTAAAVLGQVAAGLSAYSINAILNTGGNAAQNLASAWSYAGAALGTGASIASASASLEEKQKDWTFQLQLANQDVTISQDQVGIANENVAIANQDLTNATMQANHAQATVSFLSTKFTNADLYRWMSGVLGGVYAYFLRQATAMARLAETQLAFERQQTALSIIQADYWQPLSNASSSSGTSGGQAPDRAGLTGAERLLEDITQLDQIAFATDQRKLQITKTISLAQFDPFAFQQFTQTGVLRFDTPMDIFDMDFPGHYLRMINQVRVSVIALTPPTQGIRATLANDGISQVMIQNDSGSFLPVTVRRDPQLIALSSPSNATGLFNLTDQSNLLLPFEDLGVDTSWEFIMPQASNPFDYTTIADVLLAIDYTALDSPDFRKQVIQQLDQSVSADRGYSFRQQFADAWYMLNNPDQSTSPMVVQFQTQNADFPPNVSNTTIAQLLLYFVSAPGIILTQQPTAVLTFAGTDVNGNPKTTTGSADALNNVISTRRGNASAWIVEGIVGMQPAGTWTLDLSKPDMSSAFKALQIQDILFVITHAGQTPLWPS